MRKIRKFNDEILTLNNMLNIVETYQEIAAMRMRRVKRSVLNSREFLVDLNDAFRAVTFAYEEYLRRVKKSEETGEILGKNGRDVMVFLSANMGLYGDIIRKTFEMFKDDVLKNPPNTDVVIVGKSGLDMYKLSNLDHEYTYFELSDSGHDPDNLRQLLERVLEYSQIRVYHGFFKSVLSQVPKKTFVTGNAANLEDDYDKKGEAMFLFEPSVEEVSSYFEREVLSSVFEQVTFESDLSKFSARMVSLYVSSDSIKKSLNKISFAVKKFNHKMLNSKQITQLSSIYLWN